MSPLLRQLLLPLELIITLRLRSAIPLLRRVLPRYYQFFSGFSQRDSIRRFAVCPLVHLQVRDMQFKIKLMSNQTGMPKIFSRGHATLELAVSVCPSVPPSEILLNWVRFPHYGPCQTVRDCFAWYPALLKLGSEEEKKVFREMIT